MMPSRGRCARLLRAIPLERRRLEQLLTRQAALSPEQLRTVRALEVLEQAGTAEACG